jgi:hypothetical protein
MQQPRPQLAPLVILPLRRILPLAHTEHTSRPHMMLLHKLPLLLKNVTTGGSITGSISG